MKFQHSHLTYLVFLLLFCSASNVYGVSCDEYTVPPSLDIKINYGKLHYDNTKSNDQFPSKPYATTMGLTVSNFTQGISADTSVTPLQDGTFCVTLNTVHVKLGFPRIDIYIDKKYKPGTCNYKVVKAHEEYHARVQQEGLKFFDPKIRKAFRIAASKMKSEHASSAEQAQAVASSMLDRIQHDVKPTLDFVQKRLTEENLVIDTPESYAAETQKCPKW